MITLVVHYQVKPGTSDAVVGLLRELQTASRAEPGCIRYDVARVLDDTTRYMLFEQYVDEDALTSHTMSDHFRRIVEDDLSPLLVDRVRERYVSAD
jgi:quinol monooxygenase YgiN